MSKELEAFENIMRIYGETNSLEGTYNDFLIIKRALQRLEQIDNSSPSEALKSLKRIREFLLHKTKEVSFQDLRDIEQSLIKSQENEKMLEIIKNKRVDILGVEIYENYEHYYRVEENSTLKKDWLLTQEEFDLLKRWLENE